ncbi:MAG: D-cysteine desulfhydrase family protein [Pseudomonadales bacterium]
MISTAIALPRIPLAHLPTPLVPLDRLSEALGGPRIWMKRDDCTGLGTGGNKTRKLEFLLGAARQEGADVVITFGAVQSNHARQTAAACAVLGLPCHLILARKVPWPDPGYERLGNLLLDRLFGAHVHLVEASEVRATHQRLLADLEQRGHRPYVIPTGGSNAVGALGYAFCADELLRQCDELAVELTDLVHATSSAGTQAGLLAGLTLLGHLRPGNERVAVHGINVSEPPSEVDAQVETIGRLAAEAVALAGGDGPMNRAAVRVDSDYLGEGYGLPTPATIDAIRQVASLEGVLLDPVYSGKAMSGLIARIGQGEFDGRRDVVFLHTGGTASLPVYGDMLLEGRDTAGEVR